MPPAHCVISLVNGIEPACMVHTHMAPCPRDGEPASGSVVHSDCIPSRDAAITMWELRTHRQRTLVLHLGNSIDGTHSLGVNDVDCPCRPEVIWAAQFDAEKGAA